MIYLWCTTALCCAQILAVLYRCYLNISKATGGVYSSILVSLLYGLTSVSGSAPDPSPSSPLASPLPPSAPLVIDTISNSKATETNTKGKKHNERERGREGEGEREQGTGRGLSRDIGKYRTTQYAAQQ